MSLGNAGDWINSAGMTENSSEWHVLEQNNWDNLGSHLSEIHPVKLTEVTINLYDSYGDGWKRNVLNVGLPSQDGAVELTIENGSEESYVLCLQMEPIQYLMMVEIIKARFHGKPCS